MATRQPEPPGRFSLLGLLAGSAYEAGLAQIAADKYGQPQARGLAVPHRRMIRDLGVGTATGGGNIASGQQIQAVAAAVRPTLVLEAMGAERVEVNATGEVLFPRWSGGTGGWLAEGEASVSDAAAIASVSATPHCAAARLGMSRRLRNQAREDVEAAVLRELGQCVAATLEGGFLAGTGTNEEPLGLINTPGIGSQSFAGAVPTLAELVGMVETYGDADGDLGAARWLLHPSDVADLLKAQVDPDGGETIVQLCRSGCAPSCSHCGGRRIRPTTGNEPESCGIGGPAPTPQPHTAISPMARIKRPNHSTGWMQGYGAPPTLEAACQALEARLNEGRPPLFADAIAREPFDREWWAL